MHNALYLLGRCRGFSSNTKMKHLGAVIFLAVLGMPAVHAVPIHKWVDSSGNVHYSNVPPLSGAKSSVMEYKGIGDTSKITKKEGEKPVLEVDPEVQKRIAEEKEIARQNCVRSKESIQMLESGVRISRMSAKGERETLDDKGRAEELERAKKASKDWCSE